MRKSYFIYILSFLFLSTPFFAQKITVEGYAYEENDRGFLNEVKIVILDKNSRAVRAEAFSNMDGFFTVELAPESDFVLQASKKVFKSKEQEFTTKGTAPDKKLYLKVEMGRKPGYLFDVTLSEKRVEQEVVDAIQFSKIEVYNNTKKEETLVLDEYEAPNFNVTFEQGNHYTVMIRKEGFFTKRMEAYVNVKGCILCFDGVGDVRPGVSDVMTKNNTMGTLLANVELDRVKLNKSIKIENIYYDLAKWNIRKDAAEELDKLLITLKDNPSIIVELGSHTDCRGKDAYNLNLSQKRADAAVAYLVENGIDAGRIKAKGYGETKHVNECEDGVRCSERRHQLNRRTELKIIGFLKDDPYSKLSLKEIIEEEQFQKMLEEVQNQEVIQVREGDEMPEEIKNPKEAEENKKQNIPNQPISSNEAIEFIEPTTETEKPVVEDIPTSIETPPTTVVESPPTTIVEEVVEEVVATAPPQTKVITSPISTDKPVKASAERPSETILPSTNSGTQNTGKVVSGSDIEILIQTDPILKQQGAQKIVVEDKVASYPSISLASIPADYTGYRIEILSSNSKLTGSHKLFSQYGNLTMEERKDGKFSYLVGSFFEKKDAKDFLEHIVAPRYPDAQVINYFKGRRIRE